MAKHDNTTQVRIECHKCNHAWTSTSKMKRTTCPNCGLKTDNPKFA